MSTTTTLNGTNFAYVGGPTGQRRNLVGGLTGSAGRLQQLAAEAREETHEPAAPIVVDASGNAVVTEPAGEFDGANVVTVGGVGSRIKSALFSPQEEHVERRLRLGAALIMAAVPTAFLAAWYVGRIDAYAVLFVFSMILVAVGTLVRVHRQLVAVGRLALNIKMIGRLAVYATVLVLVLGTSGITWVYGLIGAVVWMASEIVLIHAILDKNGLK